MVRLRGGAAEAALMVVTVGAGVGGRKQDMGRTAGGPKGSAAGGAALGAVDPPTVKGRAPRAGYSRERFGTARADTDSHRCDTRVVPKPRGAVAEFSRLVQGAVRHAR